MRFLLLGMVNKKKKKIPWGVSECFQGAYLLVLP